MQWWGALTQQFQQIATDAMKDAAKQTALDTTRNLATGLAKEAFRTATGMAGQIAAKGVQGAARRVTPAKAPSVAPAGKAAPRKAAAKKSTAAKSTTRRAAAKKTR